MEFDKRTILAIVLIGLVLLFVQSDFYKDNFLPQPPPSSANPSEEIKPEVQAEQSATVAESRPTVIEEESQSEAHAEGTLQNLPKEEAEGREITVETNLYKAVFSTKGAALQSFRLKDYLGPDGEFVELVGQNEWKNLVLRLPSSNDTINTEEFVFETASEKLHLSSANTSEQMVLTLKLGEQGKVRKTFTFYSDSYDIGLRIELINLERVINGYSYLLSWQSGMSSTEKNFKKDMASSRFYVFQGEVENFQISDERDQKTFEGRTDWVALRTKYFTTAIIPRSAPGQAVTVVGVPEPVGEDVPFRRYAYDLKMPFDQKPQRIDDFSLYFGPLHFDTVSSYDVGLEDMMDLGWALFRPFGKFVTWSFTLLHTVIPNYGLVIIVFSILVKLLLFPLTRKSYKSMKEMQMLQPLMQELNEKYKDNAQKKQEETMKMYKEYGINPLGGCIPMFLQMPLLIALFSVFRSTIELRGAYFVWWIKDLSVPDTVLNLSFSIPMYGDTVNILPLFMGVTMFIQQKISMKDPKQKAMVYFMPVFLTLMFNSFPSGLNLYYALFNLLSIIQEKLIPYNVRTLEEIRASRSKQPKKKRRLKHDYRGGRGR